MRQINLSISSWLFLLTVPILAKLQPPISLTFDDSIIDPGTFSVLNLTGNNVGQYSTPLSCVGQAANADLPTCVGPHNPTHTTGLISDVQNLFVGPDTGVSPSSANTWTIQVQSNPAGVDTKFIVLHFTGIKLPGNNQLEVDLNYDPQEKDVFGAADVPANGHLWTRPINIKPLAGNPIIVRYITNGATTGEVQLTQIGVGQPVNGRLGSRSNSDPFLLTTPFVEPTYDPWWFCTQPPTWENTACVTDPSDVRARAARSVGMIVGPTDTNKQLSTCSCTLVDTDKVILAGHCVENEAEALASSVIFDYQTNCDGTRPTGYNPRFFKVKKMIDRVWSGHVDYLYLQIEAPPGVPPLQLRPDLPDPNENVFGLHHANGSPRKLSIPHPGFVKPSSISDDAITVPKPFHVSGGSSGSALFDTAGRVLGVLSGGNPCGRGLLDLVGEVTPFDLIYYPSSSILKKISTPPVDPPISRDVMIVFDRSGSMSQLDLTNRKKIEVARDAVSLFVQLVRKNTGNHVGLVSFSTTASSPVDFPIQGVDDNTKVALVGPKPFSGGKVGSLMPDGSTSISDGLVKAGQQLSPGGTNPRSILLMTDGMQNAGLDIDNVQVQNEISGITVHAIGLGQPGNLNGILLNKLAAQHGGIYSNAVSGVALQKFFSQAFGNIFESGILKDPEFDIPANQQASEPLEFQVCGEDIITVAVGWDNPDASLRINLTTPAGQSITGSSSGVEEAVGRAWTFLRVPLPYGSERSGEWTVEVSRPRETQQIPTRQQSEPPLHYFLNIIPTGGPRLERVGPAKSYFTGDVINPLVNFHFNDDSWPADAKLELTLSRPNVSLGNIISRTGLKAPVEIGHDVIPSRQATLAASGVEISLVEETLPLFNEPGGSGGFFEETGIYGTVLKENLTTEGEYLFHIRAKTEGSCVYNRELLWSVHVDVGIDPAHTSTTTVFTSTGTDGKSDGTITIRPGDKYGNPLGPGRSSDIPVTGVTGTTITGSIKDNGDGTYTIPITWDPNAGSPPGIVISQPGRDPIVVTQPGVCTPPITNPGGGGKCERCIPDPGKNKCHPTTSCSNTPFGTMCACRPGYRADAKGDANDVHWRLKWPVAGHEHRVYVAPGQVCDTLCDKWYLGAEGCQEVAVNNC